MLNVKFLKYFFLTLVFVFPPLTAYAKQCIKNNSGAVLDVTWYNANGHKDDQASNSSLSVGFEACQDNKNLGYAKVECSGCIFAELAAKGAVTLGGAGAYGVCLAASGGGCSMAGGVFAAATTAAISSIPPAFNGKKVIIPDKGKTMVVEGNAFGLKIAK